MDKTTENSEEYIPFYFKWGIIIMLIYASIIGISYYILIDIFKMQYLKPIFDLIALITVIPEGIFAILGTMIMWDNTIKVVEKLKRLEKLETLKKLKIKQITKIKIP